MRVSTSEEPCIFAAGRDEEIGSHRQMSRNIKLPSFPARAGLRTQATWLSPRGLAGVDLERWGGSKSGGLTPQWALGPGTPMLRPLQVISQLLVCKSVL